MRTKASGFRLQASVLAIAVLLVLGALAGPAAAQDYEELFEQGLEQLQAKQYDESIATFKKCIEMRPKASECYYNIACAYSLRGDKDQGIEWFGKSLEKGFQGDEAYDHIQQDGDLDGIRGDPRFKDLMAKWFPPKGKAGEGGALETLKGEPAALEKLKGKVVIVDFWRTWCEPCREEIPTLVAMQKELGAKGLVVVGISDEAVPLQEQLADELKVNYTLLRQTGRLDKPFDGVRVFPTKFILDQEGRVVKKIVGTATRAELDEAIQALLPPEAPKEPEQPPQVF